MKRKVLKNIGVQEKIAHELTLDKIRIDQVKQRYKERQQVKHNKKKRKCKPTTAYIAKSMPVTWMALS